MNGSHSQPLMITVSIFFSFGGFSFTWAGKAAPPKPTMPASRMALRMSSGAADSGETGNSHRIVTGASPPASITIDRDCAPVG